MPVLSPLQWCVLAALFIGIVAGVKTALWWLRTPHYVKLKLSLQSSIASLRSKSYK